MKRANFRVHNSAGTRKLASPHALPITVRVSLHLVVRKMYVHDAELSQSLFRDAIRTRSNLQAAIREMGSEGG